MNGLAKCISGSNRGEQQALSLPHSSPPFENHKGRGNLS